MRTFSPKDAIETVVLTMDFTADLNSGETLSGAPSVTVVVVQGTDPSVSSMLVGAPVISGNTVQQVVTAGVDGAAYGVTGGCGTSQGRILAIGGILPVQNAYLH